MNLSELQAFLEDSNWDDDPEPAHPEDAVDVPAREGPIPTLSEDLIPTLTPELGLQSTAFTAPVKLVPPIKEAPSQAEPQLRASDSVRERLLEVEIAQKMGYLLCKCSWPPQIMVLTGTDHVYRCRRCSRVREM